MDKLKLPWPTPLALAVAATLAATVLAPDAQAQATGAAPWVAGLTPDRRPEAAPTEAALTADAALRQRRLAGISRPWPGQIERVAEQGRWYSPMFLAGMTGLYDLRGWHRPDR